MANKQTQRPVFAQAQRETLWRRKGGFYFTSEKGGNDVNAGGSMAGSDNNLIPIDILLAAAGFPTDGGEVENTKKFIQIFKEGGKKAGEIIELAEGMVKGLKGAYDAGDKIGESLDKLKGKMWKKGSVYHDEDLGVNIERNSDSTGSLTDKTPTDTLHNKVKKK